MGQGGGREQRPGRDQSGDDGSRDGGGSAGGDVANLRTQALLRRRAKLRKATAWNEEHSDMVARFNKLTHGACAGSDGGVDVEKLRSWQEGRHLIADGLVGEKTIDAAQREAKGEPAPRLADQEPAPRQQNTNGGMSPSVAALFRPAASPEQGQGAGPPSSTVSFSDAEANASDEDAGAASSANQPVDAASIISQGDSSHNRDRAPKHEIEREDVEDVADFIMKTLDAMGVRYIGRGPLIAKLVQARSARDVYNALKDEITPEALVEVFGKVSKHFGWEQFAEAAETVAPLVAGAMAGLEFAALSMKYIIGPANKEGRERAQLNRYAAAWAFRFLDDGYSPETLPEIDEQMELMNTCSRLGVEDAIKTLAKLGPRAEGMRKQLIAHYGSIGTARENLALELLKRAGAI